MSEQRVLIDTAQTLRSYPRVTAGGPLILRKPTSVTVRIRTPSTPLPTTEASATVDSLSGTMASAASEGDDSVTATGALSFVRGTRYLLQPTAAPAIEVEAAHTVSSTTMKLTEPLPCDVATSSSILGWSVTKALTTAQTDLAGEGLAIWTALIDGVSYSWSQTFRIVRRMPVSTLTPTRLVQAWNIMRGLASRKDDDFEEAIRVGWEHRIIPLLAARGIAEEDVVAVDALEPLHALGVVLHFAEGNPRIDVTTHERLEKRWAQLCETTFARHDWYDAPQESDPSSRPAEPPTVKTGIRLVR